MRTSAFGLVIVAFFCVPTAISSAPGPLDEWQRELPVTTGELQYFKGEFIGLGLWATKDGRHWERRLNGSGPYALVTTEDDLIVPITARVYTSKDARTFSVHQLPFHARFEDLAYGGGNFVAYWQQSGPGSSTGSLMWSPDALTWTQTVSNVVSGAIEFAHTNFFAWLYLKSGDSYGWSRGISVDGTSWDFTALPPGTPTMRKLSYGKGIYVGVGAIQENERYSHVITTFHSPEEVAVRRISEAERYDDVLFDGSKFVVVGHGTFYSADGLAWQSGNIPPQVKLQSIAYGNGLYVAAGGSSKYTSLDGINWARQTEAISRVPSITFGNDRFVAFADTGTGTYALVSTNRNDWSFVDLPMTNQVEIGIFAQNQFLGIGNEGTAVRSADGFTWERFETGLPSVPLKLLYEAELFYALCQQGTVAQIYSAQNPAQWRLAASLEQSTAHSFAISGETIVVSKGIFPQPPVLTISTNSGVSWTSIPLAQPIRDLIFANDRFVGVGDYSYIVTSRDGLAWKELQITNKLLTRVQFGGGSFVAAGRLADPITNPSVDLHTQAQDFFYSSSDGETWTKHHTGITGQVLGMAYGARSWVWGLDGGQIMRSSPVLPSFRAEEFRVVGKTALLSIENPAVESITVEVSIDLRSWTPLTNSSAPRINLEQTGDTAFFRLRP